MALVIHTHFVTSAYLGLRKLNFPVSHLDCFVVGTRHQVAPIGPEGNASDGPSVSLQGGRPTLAGGSGKQHSSVIFGIKSVRIQRHPVIYLDLEESEVSRAL